MTKKIINRLEKFISRKLSGKIAHKIDHSYRVKKWALKIARVNKYDLVKTEIAALLHDIGQSVPKPNHGQQGAIIAHQWLKKNSNLETIDINDICLAITHHNNSKPTDHNLSLIIRDADQLDMLGAIGIMRAFTSKSDLEPYDPTDPKGKTWQKDKNYFNQILDRQQSFGPYIIDQINYQISRYQNLNTPIAKKIARPLVEYMKNFILQLEKEIKYK